MEIRQGEIYWIDMEEPHGSGPGYRHPHVVVQNNMFNQSRIRTVVVCELTTNLRRAQSPGNVLLEAGEANLPEPSVVNISQIVTIDKAQLGDYIGALARGRVRQIVEGIQLLIQPAEVDEIQLPA
jgi:mRNA interferase MazF